MTKRRVVMGQSLRPAAYVSPAPGDYAPEREPSRWDAREEQIHSIWRDMGTQVPGVCEEVDELAVERDRRRAPYFVYFLEAELSGGIYKIGFTQSVQARAAELSTGCPFRLIEAASFPCPSEKIARALEREVHVILKKTGRYLRGEWFRIRDRADVEKLKAFAQLKLENMQFDEVAG